MLEVPPSVNVEAARRRVRTSFRSTHELLDFAYGVVTNADRAMEHAWYEHVWPLVQRIEVQLRMGKARGLPSDEQQLAQVANVFAVLAR